MKKKVLTLLVTLAMLVSMLLVAAPAAVAADHTDHCVCGGKGAGNAVHTCADLTDWIPLTTDADGDLLMGETEVPIFTTSYANTTSGRVYLLPTGNYYLTANIDLKYPLAVGSDEPDVDKNVDKFEATVCLKGYKLNNPANTEDINDEENRAIVLTDFKGTLNITDCVGTGTVSGTCATTGGVAFLNSSGGRVLNIYAGTISPVRECTQAGGAIRINGGTVNLYGGTIKDGHGSYGGNVAIYNATFNMYGGSVENGTAASKGFNIHFSSGAATIYGGAVVNGNINGSIAIKGGFIELAGDYAANITQEYDLGFDLNGRTLSGTIATGTHKLYIADSTAEEAGTAGTGKVTATVTGTVAQGEALPAVAGNLAGQRYVTIDGVAHRIYVGFDKIQLYKDDNGNIGMNYVTNFKMDDDVKALLVDDVDGNAAGCCFGVGDPELRMGETVGLAKAAYKADIATNIAAILDGEGDATAIATKIYANTFVNLNIGGQTVTVTSNTYGYSLQDVVDALNGIADLAAQNAAAAELLADIKSRFN